MFRLPNQQKAAISIEPEVKYKWFTPKSKEMKSRVGVDGAGGASNNSVSEDGLMSSSEDHMILQVVEPSEAADPPENDQDEMSSADDYLFSMIGADKAKEDE